MVEFLKVVSRFFGISVKKNRKDILDMQSNQDASASDQLLNAYKCFEATLSNMSCYTYCKNMDFVYIGCNNLVVDISGLPDQSFIVGKTDYDFGWDINVSNSVRKLDELVIKTGQAQRNSGTIIKTNGKIKILLDNKKPVFDKKNNIIGIIGLSVDITEVKEKEQSLIKLIEEHKTSNKAAYAMSKKIIGYDLGQDRSIFDYMSNVSTYFEKIISHMPCCVYWKDKNFVYLGCNDLAAQTMSLPSRRSVIGKTDYDFGWDIERSNSIREADELIIKTGQVHRNFEGIIKKADGNTVVLLGNKVPVFDEDNNVIGIVGISTDITDRKEKERLLIEAKEQAEAASRAKTDFLQNMRHDLRTPLAGIVGCAELLNSTMHKAEIQKLTGHILASGTELLDFLNKVLESVEMNSGEIPVLVEKFNLRQTLEKVVALHKSIATDKKINLILDVDDTIPEFLLGDSMRIYRIILELLGNALKFTAKGYVRVFAKLEKQELQLILKIFIEDTGPGIPSDKQKIIFERFSRLTASHDGTYKGTGLGLAIAKKFLDDLEAEIYIDSELGKGTKFVCIIPVKRTLLDGDPFENVTMSTSIPVVKNIKADTSIPVNKVNKENIKGESIIKLHVLIVEDNPIASFVAKTLLLAEGCEVDTAENGQTAITLAQNNNYDFILMDIGLPDIDGCEVTKNIRLFEKNTNRAPTFIVGLTAHVDEENKQEAINIGMDSVLSKPLTKEITAEILESILQHMEVNDFC